MTIENEKRKAASRTFFSSLSTNRSSPYRITDIYIYIYIRILPGLMNILMTNNMYKFEGKRREKKTRTNKTNEIVQCSDFV